MNAELQTTDHPMARSTDGPMKRRLPARLIAPWQHRALRAEWAKFSPQLEWECTEREARLRFTNDVLRPSAIGNRPSPILSWATLTYAEANRLLRVLKESSGSNGAWRAMKLAQIAAELFGAEWNAVLRDRLVQRFRTPDPQSLSPGEAHEIIEELLSRIARRDGVGIEAVRKRIFPSNHRAIGSSPQQIPLGTPRQPQDATESRGE